MLSNNSRRSRTRSSNSDAQQQQQQQQGERLSQQRQQQLVEQQQQRLTQYRQHLGSAAAWVRQQRAGQLQQQKRTAQYRFQEDYLERLRQQQVFLENDRGPDYDHDPYFYTAPIYRYNRGGSYYETNQYGADISSPGRELRLPGRLPGWSRPTARIAGVPTTESSYAYQDANYGYNGYYVAQDDYNYYFRQGFQSRL